MIVPDPLADLIPTIRPALFDLLPSEERRWRLRLYLACWAMGCPDELSWAMALDDGATDVAESMAILAGITDDAIRAAAANRIRSEGAMKSGGSHKSVTATRPATQMQRQLARSAPSLTRHPTESISPGPVQTGQEHWDRLLAESRLRPQQPSKVTLLVPSKRRHVAE